MIHHGFKKKNEQPDMIVKHLEKCLIYHFFVSDIKEKDIREDFRNHDSIANRAGGGFIETATKNLLSNPEIISNKLNKKEQSEKAFGPIFFVDKN